MRAAGEVAPRPGARSRFDVTVARRRERRADRPSRPLHHHRRPRETRSAAARRRGSVPCRDRVDVRRRRARAAGRPSRSASARCRSLGAQHPLVDQPLAQQPVLRHRKPVLLGQRQHEGVGVEGSHGHGGFANRRCLQFYRNDARLKTIDAHAAGEPLRLIVDGFPVAARQDDARQARVGADARRSPAPGADARAARARRHVRRDPHRAGGAGLARRRPLHAQRRLQHDVRPRRHRGDDDGARARAADAGRRRHARSSTTRRPGRFGRARRIGAGRAGRDRRGGRARTGRERVVPERAVVRAARRADREARRRGRFAPTSPSAAPSTRSSTARRSGLPIDAAHLPELRRVGMEIKHAIEAAHDRRASARCRADGHLRHDLHRPAERRAAPTCATSRSSPTPKSIARRAAPAPRR